MRWPTSRSPLSSLTEPLSATRPGSVDGGVGLGTGDHAGGGDARVRPVAAELAHERLDVGDPLLGAVGAVLGGDGVDRDETRGVIQLAAQPLGDAGDRLVPGGEIAGGPGGAVEPVEGVVGALVAVLRVEERAEAGLRAGDGDEEDGVDAVLLPLADEGGAAAGHGGRVLGEEGVEGAGVGARRGRRRERAGQGGGQQQRDGHEDGLRTRSVLDDPHSHPGSLCRTVKVEYSRAGAVRRPGPDAVPGGARGGTAAGGEAFAGATQQVG